MSDIGRTHCWAFVGYVFVGAEDDTSMQVQSVVAATGQMPLDFPKSAVLDMHIRWVIETFPIRARFLELGAYCLNQGFESSLSLHCSS